MLAEEGVERHPSDQFYSRETKCCTYLPELKNFLVGRILADRDPAAARGRATVQVRSRARVGVTPLGLARTPFFSNVYESTPAAFGRDVALRCPHYLTDTGHCGIWRHRESTCATWFCKFDRGETSRTFWRRLHDLLALSETALGLHCLLELGVDRKIVEQLIPPSRPTNSGSAVGRSRVDRGGDVDPARYAAVWGKWEGREEELYVAAAEIAAKMSFRQVLSLGGSEARRELALLRQAYTALRVPEVPVRLARRQLEVLPSDGGRVRVVGYSNLDPLRVSKELLDALHCFDGSPASDAVLRVEREHGLRLTTDQVQRLVDFGILGPSDS
jgi:hypothetical protein